jgi:WD40 repeat protein
MWSPDGKFVVTAQGGSTHLWDSATGKLAMSFSHSNSVRAIAVSADGTHLATGHNDKTVQIWEMRTGRHKGALKAAEKIGDIRFSPDGRLVAISTFNSGSDGVVEVLDVASGKVVGRPLRHRDEVVSFEFSPDGTLLATACNDHTARVWDAATGEPVTPWLPHDFETRKVFFSPDGARLATLARRGAARLWNARTGEPLSAPIVYARNEGTGGVSYSPDGLRLLISRGGNEAWLRELQPETATLEELRLRAEVLSCTRFDAAAGMVPLDESSLNLAWKQLRAFHAKN